MKTFIKYQQWPPGHPKFRLHNFSTKTTSEKNKFQQSLDWSLCKIWIEFEHDKSVNLWDIGYPRVRITTFLA